MIKFIISNTTRKALNYIHDKKLDPKEWGIIITEGHLQGKFVEEYKVLDYSQTLAMFLRKLHPNNTYDEALELYINQYCK